MNQDTVANNRGHAVRFDHGCLLAVTNLHLLPALRPTHDFHQHGLEKGDRVVIPGVDALLGQHPENLAFQGLRLVGGVFSGRNPRIKQQDAGEHRHDHNSQAQPDVSRTMPASRSKGSSGVREGGSGCCDTRLLTSVAYSSGRSITQRRPLRKSA